MAGRTGEKIGWIAGWSGGFIWVVILSVLFFVQGKWVQGSLGLVITLLASAGIVFFAPWRFHSKPYWLLMIVPYVMFFLAVGWAIGSYGGFRAAGLSWWSLLWLLPLLLPFGGLWKGKWQDLEEKDTSPPPEMDTSSEVAEISEITESEISEAPDEKSTRTDASVPEKKNRMIGIIKKIWNPILSLFSKLFRKKKN